MLMVYLISFCYIVSTITTLMFCLCWRKKSQKSEWPGLDGLVTQKNPDENVNHLDGPPAIINDVVDSKRPSVVNNPRRSLPDIPSDGDVGINPAEGDIVTYEPSGDNSSDLYATVEPYQHFAKRHTLPNGIITRPSVSQHSSISQADDTFSPYARVKEHPYDKLKKTEHPYARVQPGTSQPEDSSLEATPRKPTAIENVGVVTIEEPLAPPRSRRSSTHSTQDSDIPAASAVAGGIAANPELPYMTPPVTQVNFSGDSQDSSKGYTSISVREPLANIRAQTKLAVKRQDLDPHYSTVSDDSDDMYTTIQDPNSTIYSGSETYAQIQPPQQLIVEAEVNQPPPSPTLLPVPQPPSVDSLKHVTAHTHSRQASSSSSVGNLGSPKPEKRQANSPLPPPPPTTEFPTCKNLDDMYAKVQKHKRKEDEKQIESNMDREEVGPIVGGHNYETLRKNKEAGDAGYEQLKPRDVSEPGYSSINGPMSLGDAGYEIVETDPNYEELQVQTQADTAGYSQIKKSQNVSNSSDEPNYESMPSSSISEPAYAPLISGSDTDPNYESVKYLDEPPYERLQDDGKDPDYEKVEKVENEECKIDYGYETIKKNKGGGLTESDEDSIVQV